MTLVSVEGLTIAFDTPDGPRRVVDDVSFSVPAKGRLGLIGESGSGKTMIGRAILNLLPPGARIVGGRILFDGEDLLTLEPAAMRAVRGSRIGMVFQEPMTSLNPSLTVGRQMTEGPMHQQGLTRADAERAARQMLERVQLRDPAGALARHPHEFSGGMRQRIMLASVLMMRPALLIADEPTTALDAVIQKEVMDLMSRLVEEEGTALILVSHDLPLVAQHTNEAVILQSGRAVETGKTGQILTAPRDPYTKRLVDALPTPRKGRRAATPPVVAARGVRVVFEGRRKLPWSRPAPVVAVDNVDIEIREGEIVGLVGESGSGKTTLGRALVGLAPMKAGEIRLDGAPRPPDFRRRMQIIFQDPYASLDPRMTVARIVSAGLRRFGPKGTEGEKRLREILDGVQLPLDTYGARLPHELSGGQRQRVCIARALVTHPRFVVADEPVSALDLTVQKEVLTLLADLRERLGFSCLFVSHDMGVIEALADRAVVMKDGRVVERADCADLFAAPSHAYTRRLLDAVPRVPGAVERPI
ncbi:MAG: ABC transporter ATP-binding protein [Roseitalea sp.]|jgi:peptide/nickel transport system ATP-binding protein|nr:ABC transporter ATP-binding protein [Roseitalea sp.]MBO6721468.1 ABC transporter ATP-binding protein [Roseitalea sp.]MBO6742025.1 ABC transporter ATP-binding protein [Roseitalea sp.]